eukprot:14365697-Ditylum_brightwellii.AAC.1
MVDSGKEKAATFHDEKYQGGKTLPFLDYEFTENKRQLKVKNFLKATKEVKDLLGYSVIDGRNKN